LKSTIKRSLLLALVATIMTPLTHQSVSGQDNQSAGLVAVLDVAKVFKENAGFDAKMKAIKSEADDLKVQITQQQEAIKAEAEQLGQYNVGSPERNSLEEQLEQKQTSLRTKARQAETELLNREAKIYYDTYKEMQSVVSSMASQYGISLVLRFDSDTIDPQNRAEVIKGVNRAVVFHRRLDLTNQVIKQMNPGQAQAPTGNVGR
jgi:Skp family chaperone for outer membrane proteins